MKLNNNQFKILCIVLPLVVLLAGAFLALSARAQAAPPTSRSAPEAIDATSRFIPVQGYLTDSGGNPLDGDYTLTFRLYDEESGGTALCEDDRSVTVANGLFSTYMNAYDCIDSIDGRQLYLGIEVGTDGEMDPRSYVDNVPYAWSLRPGAKIQYDLNDPLLTIFNTGDDVGLWSSSAMGEGVHAASGGGTGLFGYSLTGNGVQAESFVGTALAATGTGIITSTAESYLWVSGNDFRPLHADDPTVIDLDTVGGALIYSGGGANPQYVVLPITIPGTLYGQDVILTGLDIYWIGTGDLDGITDVRIRRQVGTCLSCYVDILHDGGDQTCDPVINSTGCTSHYGLDTNNVLSDDSGVVYLGVGLNFAGPSGPIQLGGVRLTLEYHK
jgi:hypothetical protein